MGRVFFCVFSNRSAFFLSKSIALGCDAQTLERKTLTWGVGRGEDRRSPHAMRRSSRFIQGKGAEKEFDFCFNRIRRGVCQPSIGESGCRGSIRKKGAVRREAPARARERSIYIDYRLDCRNHPHSRAGSDGQRQVMRAHECEGGARGAERQRRGVAGLNHPVARRERGCVAA